MMIDQLCQVWYNEDNLAHGWQWKAPEWKALSQARRDEIRARVLTVLRGEVRRSECSRADAKIWEGRARDLSWLETCLSDDERPQPGADQRNRWFHAWSSVLGPHPYLTHAPRAWKDEHELFTGDTYGSDYRRLASCHDRYLRCCYVRPEFDDDIIEPLEALLRHSWLSIASAVLGFRTHRLPLYTLLEGQPPIDARIPKGCPCSVFVLFNDDDARLELATRLLKRDRERPQWQMHIHVEGAERVPASEA